MLVSQGRTRRRARPGSPSPGLSFGLMRGVGGNASKKGYHVAEINRGIYLITDGGCQHGPS